MSDTIRGLRELLRVLDTPSVLCVCDLAEKPCPRCLRMINAMTKICQNVPALLDIAESAKLAHEGLAIVNDAEDRYFGAALMAEGLLRDALARLDGDRS